MDIAYPHIKWEHTETRSRGVAADYELDIKFTPYTVCEGTGEWMGVLNGKAVQNTKHSMFFVTRAEAEKVVIKEMHKDIKCRVFAALNVLNVFTQ